MSQKKDLKIEVQDYSGLGESRQLMYFSLQGLYSIGVAFPLSLHLLIL